MVWIIRCHFMRIFTRNCFHPASLFDRAESRQAGEGCESEGGRFAKIQRTHARIARLTCSWGWKTFQYSRLTPAIRRVRRLPLCFPLYYFGLCCAEIAKIYFLASSSTANWKIAESGGGGDSNSFVMINSRAVQFLALPKNFLISSSTRVF
jgi:hypothetical protein